MKPTFFSGLDLGQMSDFTAFVVVQRSTQPRPDRSDEMEHRFDVRHLQRWPLGTSYPAIVADLKTMYATDELAGSTLVIDMTGVGAGVMDMVKQSKLNATLGR